MSALPRQLNFSNQKVRATARNTLVSVHPDSGTSFNPGDNLTFRLPVNGAGRYLDTDSIQIKFTVENKHAAKKFYLNSTGAGFITRKVESQQTTLSDITGYNVLSELVLDAQCSAAQRLDSLGVMAGGSKVLSSLSARHGAEVAATTGTLDVQIGLLGGLLANSTSRYVPLSLSSPLTLQLYLESAARAVKWEDSTADSVVSNTDIVLSGWEMFYQVVELDAATNAMLVQSSGGVQSIMCDDYINTQTQAAIGITSHSPIVPFQKSSLKSMFCCMFDNAFQQKANAYCLNNRTRSKISAFQMNVDGAVRPSRPITTKATANAGEFYQQFLNAFHITPGSLHQVSMTAAEWAKEMPIQTSGGTESKEHPGAFAIGYDLDSYMGTSETSYGGLMSLSSTVSPMLTFSPATDSALSIQYFGMFDSIITCDTTTGILSVAS